MSNKEISFKRKEIIVSASEKLKNFNKEIFDYLCGKDKTDEEIKLMVHYLEDGFNIQQADFLVKINHLDKFILSNVCEAFKKGYATSDFQFLLKMKRKFLLEREASRFFDEAVSIIKAWRASEISIFKRDLIIQYHVDLYPNDEIYFILNRVDMINEEKLNRIRRCIKSGKTPDIVIKGVVENDFSEEVLSAIQKFSTNKKEEEAIYELFEAGLPIELMNEHLVYFCIMEHDFRSINHRLLKASLKEKLDIATIKNAIDSYDPQKLSRVLDRKIKKNHTKKINDKFKTLIEKFQ